MGGPAIRAEPPSRPLFSKFHSQVDGLAFIDLEFALPLSLFDRARGANTANARVTIVSDHGRVARLRFSCSGRNKAYDRLIYGGDNGCRSGDYRNLGNIVLCDGLALPFLKGENQ